MTASDALPRHRINRDEAIRILSLLAAMVPALWSLTDGVTVRELQRLRKRWRALKRAVDAALED